MVEHISAREERERAEHRKNITYAVVFVAVILLGVAIGIFPQVDPDVSAIFCDSNRC